MLKLFLVLVLSIRLIPAPPNDHFAIYIVAVTNSPSSVDDVTIEVLSQTQPYQEPRTLSGQRLPPECVFGSNSSTQCSSMLDISNTSLPDGAIFILAPLMNGVLIQKFVHKDNAFLSVEYHPLLVQLDQSCSPVIIIQSYQVPTGVYLLCKSAERLSLFKLLVNFSELSKSEAKFQESYKVDTTDLSSFAQVTSTETSIVFISNDRLYQLDLEEVFFSPIGDLPSASCMPVSQLVSVSGTLLAYCSDHSVVYFDSDGEILNVTNPLTDGVPLVCPDPDVRLATFGEGDYIKIGLWSENTYFTITLQTKIYSSVCFGNKTALYFAYTNATGSHAFKINLLEDSPIVPYTLDANHCQLGSCKPLMVFKNRWLLVQVASTPYDSSVMVFDSFNGFSVVLRRVHVDGFALGTILPLLELPSPTPSNGMVSLATISLTPTSTIPSKPPIVAIVIPITLVFIGVFLTIVVIILGARYCQQRRRREGQQPYQEISTAMPETSRPEKVAIEESVDHHGSGFRDQSTTYNYDTPVSDVGDDTSEMNLLVVLNTSKPPGQTATLSSVGSLLSSLEHHA